MAELQDVQQVIPAAQPYTPQQLFSKLKTLDGLTDTVFYVPFVQDLLRDRMISKHPTDVFSHSLAQILGNHPLVITELPKKVFEVQPPIILPTERKAAEYTILASPKTAWDTLMQRMQQVTATDRQTQRFCVFRMYEEEILCPLGVHSDKKIKVWFCNLYGNKETYYFAQGLDESGNRLMKLHYSPPIREFVELGSKLFGRLQTTDPIERIYETFAEEMEQKAAAKRLADLQRTAQLRETLVAKPLEESQLSAKQRADCYEMIRMYKQMYGETE